MAHDTVDIAHRQAILTTQAQEAKVREMKELLLLTADAGVQQRRLNLGRIRADDPRIRGHVGGSAGTAVSVSSRFGLVR